MTTLHVHWLGDKAVLSRQELEQLLELARRSEEIAVQPGEEDLLNLGILWLAQEGRAFDWLADEEDLYSLADLKVRYR